MDRPSCGLKQEAAAGVSVYPCLMHSRSDVAVGAGLARRLRAVNLLDAGTVSLSGADVNGVSKAFEREWESAVIRR